MALILDVDFEVPKAVTDGFELDIQIWIFSA
jgi:hypothetical protein